MLERERDREREKKYTAADTSHPRSVCVRNRGVRRSCELIIDASEREREREREREGGRERK